MKILSKSYRIRLTQDDVALLNSLKSYGIVPSDFVRKAIRQKIKSELPELIEQENINKSKQFCPF
jgi:hypothetical protein